MSNNEVKEYIDGMTDNELKEAFKTAETDLLEASLQQPNSEWHESCFTALVLYGTELVKRGIRRASSTDNKGE